jgi:predicted MFS family arabinose efflux permease
VTTAVSPRTFRLPHAPLHGVTIGLVAFFTLVDLFATQAILPLLAHRYAAAPAVIGVAVNASTFGMAVGALLTALFGQSLDRRLGIVASLIILTVPTALLASAPDLATFAALRVVQGLCMAVAFTLTLSHLGEVCSARAQAGAFAAYITGNVASNLIGRLMAAWAAGLFGVSATFYVFAGLNLLGALLAAMSVAPTGRSAESGRSMADRLAGAGALLTDGRVLAGFGVGFCILFAFIGVFSYVNFVLMRPPLALGMMSLGLVYFVFLPSIILTPFAGAFAARFGARRTLWLGLGVAEVGLIMLLSQGLALVLGGLVLVGAGSFFAQATATGFVSQAAGSNRSAASGLYLASYFSGGLAGAAAVGQIFDRFGWGACVGVVAVSLAAAAALGVRFAPARGDL